MPANHSSVLPDCCVLAFFLRGFSIRVMAYFYRKFLSALTTQLNVGKGFSLASQPDFDTVEILCRSKAKPYSRQVC